MSLESMLGGGGGGARYSELRESGAAGGSWVFRNQRRGIVKRDNVTEGGGGGGGDFCMYILCLMNSWSATTKLSLKAGFDISTSLLAPGSEFLKTGLSGKYILVFTGPNGQAAFLSTTHFLYRKMAQYPEIC